MPIPAGRTRLVVLATALGLALATAVTGCGASAAKTHDTGSVKPSSTDASRSELQKLWTNFRAVADQPTVPLHASLGLKPVPGFTQADVDTLTRRAIDVLKRGVQPRLSAMNPTGVIDYVFAHQYGPTTFEFKSKSSDLLAGYDYVWLAASLYDRTPTKAPKIIKVAATVTRDRGKEDDGTTAPILRVVVQIHAVQQVPTSNGELPIAVRRTVQVSSFKPRGGPKWWPSVLVRTFPFGNAECPLYANSKLVPLTDPAALRRDLADLKISLDTHGIVPQTFGNTISAATFRTYVKRTCND